MKKNILLYLTLIIGLIVISCDDGNITNEPVHYIQVSQRKITVGVGDQYKITPSFDSKETVERGFNWQVRNTEIAEITTIADTVGIVKGLSPGGSIIEIFSKDNELKYYIELEVTDEAPPVRILTIGNSFSEDAVENYLYNLAKAAGKNIVIGNLYIGGASLELHWTNINENLPAYQLRKIDNNGELARFNDNTIFQAIRNENWDYISFQEVSQLSGIIDGYAQYLPQLVEYASKFATNPEVKFILHQTWAYSEDSNHEGFYNYDRDQNKMFNAIVNTVEEARNLADIELVVPSGTAIQNGRTSYIGDRFTRDGFHLDLGIGRFTAASTWFEALFGGILENPFYPENLLMYDTELAKQAAYDAVNQPKVVTDLVAYKERGPNEFTLEHPLFIDFGPKLSPDPYNNFIKWQDGSISGLKDEQGNNSAYILKAGMQFHEGVIDRAMPNLLGLPLTASQDAFFNDGLYFPDGSSLILSNLNNYQKYSFVLYGTINDRGTQSEYRVIGKNEGFGLLDTDHNLSKKVIINDIEPDENGEITIIIKKGPDAVQQWGYYGLNAMIVLPGGTTYEFPENDFELENPLYVDFGLWLSGYPFNNFKDPWDIGSNEAAPVLEIIDNKGNNTGFAIAITEGWSAVNDLGAWGNTLGLPDEVAVDAFWGDIWRPEGHLTLSNLNKSESYDLTFYASRRDKTENLETTYEVIGENSGTASVNAANNNTNTAVVQGISPDSEGNILIKVKPGPNNNSADKFYYLNTMIIAPGSN